MIIVLAHKIVGNGENTIRRIASAKTTLITTMANAPTIRSVWCIEGWHKVPINGMRKS